ncbi:hypothetical protein CYMTET_34842 [Cymbomonas tetramitiformis]|uniref:Uncharacterized protein n=1 Tax=Cymbomonas tetramitiformis TaxID=36881 RepID=A0AAE0FAC5_9CHLO|nr:hypothetical protein CYMTET_34842 [Cymbomonas tetramitiformis]
MMLFVTATAPPNTTCMSEYGAFFTSFFMIMTVLRLVKAYFLSDFHFARSSQPRTEYRHYVLVRQLKETVLKLSDHSMAEWRIDVEHGRLALKLVNTDVRYRSVPPRNQ